MRKSSPLTLVKALSPLTLLIVSVPFTRVSFTPLVVLLLLPTSSNVAVSVTNEGEVVERSIAVPLPTTDMFAAFRDQLPVDGPVRSLLPVGLPELPILK